MNENKEMNCILGLLSDLQPSKQLLKAIEDKRVINISGLDETAASAIVGLIRKQAKKPVVFVCENELLARRNAEDLNSLGVSAKVLPPPEISFLKADASSREVSIQRLGALGDFLTDRIHVLVVPTESLLVRTLSSAQFMSNCISVQANDTLRPDELILRLCNAGYERTALVEARGQCALRGGIVDVYPIGMPNAVRIEFFDNEVDSIREFDVLTQRSLGHIQEACIYPAREALFTDDQAVEAAERLKKMLSSESTEEKLDRQRTIEKQFDLLPFEQFFEMTKTEEGDEDSDELPSMWDLQPAEKEDIPKAVKRHTSALEKRFMPIVDALRNHRTVEIGHTLTSVLNTESADVLSLKTEALVIFEHPDRIKQRCIGLKDDFLLNYKAAFERGEALKEQADLLLNYEQILEDAKKHTIVSADAFLRSQYDIAPQALIKFESVGTPGFSMNMRDLASEVKRLKEKNAYIALLSGGVARGQRLNRAFSEEDMIVPFLEELPDQLTRALPVILPINLSSGFCFPELDLYVFCEDDIFGKGKQKRRASTSADKKMSAFTELKVGDFVVHENHGIGQYLGTVRMSIDGTLRDFLNIRYGGTDKLYVPTDQMDRIQKYIGSEGEVPKLNRLSGGDWQKQKARVKRAIKEIAGDLIKLYAERSTAPGYAFGPDTPWQKEFEEAFPFEETPDQVTAISEIKHDMEQPLVMDRLLCGDVGYGKTEVALRAVFKCVVEGKQAVLLAPTTILVQQHYATALNRFGNFPVHIDTLSRFKTPAEQKEVIRKLKTGEIDFVIGTHRLLSKEIEYKDLGLLVVDEEQRFGVGHKEMIKQYKKSVDVLTLSATPIPRTLHMSMVGIRDMSILKTPPEERYPIQTYVCEYSDGLVRDAILREISRGGQVYVLHNRVQTIELMFNRLKKLVPEARIAFAHGQMREQNLEDVMLDFYDGKFDVLLCSTIIEAGLDVPRANTLIVCDSDRFGLSQLYQLRGRVGRSNRIAYAYLTVNPSKILTQDAEKRLNAIREFTEFGSGFRVAMRDLEIRGTGNILGAEQSGHMAAVGYDLYVKMINEAISELQGTQQPEPVQTRIEVDIDAYLPVEYISADSMRIEMYKRIAEIHDDESRDDVIDELIDRFGDPDKPVMNLIYIAQIKKACEKLYIDRLRYEDGSLQMRFSTEAQLDVPRLVQQISKDKRMKLIQRQPGGLSFTEPKQPVDKLLISCTQALEGIISNMSGTSQAV